MRQTALRATVAGHFQGYIVAKLHALVNRIAVAHGHCETRGKGITHTHFMQHRIVLIAVIFHFGTIKIGRGIRIVAYK